MEPMGSVERLKCPERCCVFVSRIFGQSAILAPTDSPSLSTCPSCKNFASSALAEFAHDLNSNSSSPKPKILRGPQPQAFIFGPDKPYALFALTKLYR